MRLVNVLTEFIIRFDQLLSEEQVARCIFVPIHIDMGKKTTTTLPQTVSTKGVPQALASHGTKLYAGLLEGDVEVYDLSSPASTSSSKRIRCGTGSVRTLLGCGDSRLMVALSSGEVAHLDISRGSVIRTWKSKCDEEAGSALLGFEQHVGYVGCDDGGVRHVDLRCADVLVGELEHGDYISALSYTPGGGGSGRDDSILAASGDGSLGLYDVRNGRLKLRACSTSHDDDLLCLGVGDGVVVAGTLEGAIHAYDASQLSAGTAPVEGELTQQRHRGHPDSVNALLVQSGLAVTGCSDGLIRVVDPAAGAMLGVIDFDRSWIKDGQAQDDEERWPIETMCVVRTYANDNGCDYLALAGHDECVRFASLEILNDDDESDEEEEEKSGGRQKCTETKKRSTRSDSDGGAGVGVDVGKRHKSTSQTGDFFGGL